VKRPRATVVRLREAKLRRLEQRVEALESRVETAIDVLTRLTRVVAAIHHRYSGAMNTPQRRVERLTRAVTQGRTADLRWLTQLERRLTQLERRLHD
jgi:BMFP domain-containing protein YqiC